MIRCPLCETVQQPSPECTVCGKRFTSAPAGGEVPAGTFAELSPTRLQALPPIQVAPIEGLVRTELEARPAPVAARPAAPGAPAAPAGPIPCRYCQHVQASGRLCDRCGMRLPRIKAADVQVVPARDPDGRGRCSRCRLPGRLSAACTECGAPMIGSDGD